MLGELWGFVAAMWAIFIVLWIALALCRVVLGNTGTVIMIVTVALLSAFTGWQWLIHHDNLAVQMVGWGMVSAALLAVRKGLQMLVRKHRAESVDASAVAER